MRYLLCLFLFAAAGFAQSLTVWTVSPAGVIGPPAISFPTGLSLTAKFYYKATTGQPVNVSVTYVRPASGPSWITPTSATNLPATGTFEFTVTGNIPPNGTTGDNGHYVALVIFRSGTKTEQGIVRYERFPNTTLQADSQEFALDAQSRPSTKVTVSATIVAEIRPKNINCAAFVPPDSWVSVNPPSFSTPEADPTVAITSTEFEIKLTDQARTLPGGTHSSWVGFRNLNKPSDIIYVVVDVNVKATPSITVSGTVRDPLNQPLTGTIVTFSGVGTVAADASGRYSAEIPSGYSGTATPSLTGYTFTPPSRTYSNLTVATTGHDYTGSRLPTTVTISGGVRTAQGQPLAGVFLLAGAVGSATDASGNYALQVPFGFTGTVTPGFSNYTFSPPNRAYSNLTANAAGDNYTGTLLSVTISGTVATQQGQAVSGVALAFSNQGPTVVTDSRGVYSASVLSTWSGTVTPSLVGYTFTPPGRSYANLASNLLSESYTAVPAAYTISGRIATAQGQAVAGVTVSFGGGQPAATTDSSGAYSGRVSANYSGAITPSRSGYSFDPPSRSFANVASDQTGANFTAIPQVTNGPVITQVLNGAGFQPAIQQQSWVTIKGANLASTTGIWSDSDFVGGKLPTLLNGVSVSINGKAAAVYYTSPTQINVCAPPDAATGAVSVTVTSNGTASSPFSVQLQPFSPAFFQLGNPSGNRYAIATDGATILGPPDLVANTVPARPGQIVSLWGTGFGPVDPAPPSDTAVPSSPLFPIRIVPAIRVGGRPVEYLGGVLAGGSIGLYLINIRLSDDLPDGDQKIEIDANGTAGPDGVFLFIRR